MLTRFDSIEACKRIDGWEVIAAFAVGGFEWLGFSKIHFNLMICISSQKHTVLDCDNGIIRECEVVYDEKELTAFCDLLPDEQLAIAGQYGGLLPLSTTQGEQIKKAPASSFLMLRLLLIYHIARENIEVL